MKKHLKILAIFAAFSVLSVMGFNCARYGELHDEKGSSDQASLGAEETLDSEKLGLPYALLSAEQTLTSMKSVTNTATLTTGIINEYNNRYGSLAAGNDLNMANAPMLMGTTSLAGEFCANLVTVETAQQAAARNFFGSVDFAVGVNSLGDAAYESAIRGMARSFWGRNETMEELTLIKGYRMEFTNALAANVRTQAASSRNLMISTCAAMLSSADVITY